MFFRNCTKLKKEIATSFDDIKHGNSCENNDNLWEFIFYGKKCKYLL